MSLKSDLETAYKRWKRAKPGPARKRIRKLIKTLKAKRDRYFALWGGGRRIINEEVIPVAQRFGVAVTSRKRAANDPLSISNPSSDHNKANTNADAVDLGTFSGADLAHAIARALGIKGYSVGNFNSYFIERHGVTYRVQILWAVEGHYDHVHVGIRREG